MSVKKLFAAAVIASPIVVNYTCEAMTKGVWATTVGLCIAVVFIVAFCWAVSVFADGA